MRDSQGRPDYPTARTERSITGTAITKPECPPGADYMVMPRRMTRYVEVSPFGLEMVIEGTAADRNNILYFIRGDGPDRNAGHVAWDTAVFEGGRLIAIITRGDNRWPLIRLVEPDVGPEAAEDADDGEGADDA